MDLHKTICLGDFLAQVARDARATGTLLGYCETLPSVDDFRVAMMERGAYLTHEVDWTSQYPAFVDAYTASRAEVVAETRGTCRACHVSIYKDDPEQTLCYGCLDASTR